MTEWAARLVDEVLPRVPVRQWVLSLPYRLRYLLAWDHALARAVLGVYVRVLLGFQRHRARRYGSRDGRSGSVTVIQRFGGGLNLNVHYHTLLFDGVFFADRANDTVEFRPLPPPTDEEVGLVLARIAARVQRLLKRRGFDPGDADLCQADPVVDDSPVLAGISSASTQGRIALGPRAGGAGVAPGGRSRRALGALDGAAARAPRGRRSARQRRRASRGSHTAGTAVPLSAPAGGGAGPAATPRQWPDHAHAEVGMGGRHPAAPVRAAGTAREAGRAHSATADQSGALPRRARAAFRLASPRGYLWRGAGGSAGGRERSTRADDEPTPTPWAGGRLPCRRSTPARRRRPGLEHPPSDPAVAGVCSLASWGGSIPMVPRRFARREIPLTRRLSAL